MRDIRRAICSGLLCVFLSEAAVVAQTQWTNIVPFPSTVTAGLLVFDRHRDRIVGWTAVALGIYDLVEFDGQTWTARNLAIAANGWPQGVCYDESSRHVLVQFRFPDETYVWDGITWSLKATQPPSATYSQAMVFHRGRGRILDLVGNVGSVPSMQLREWDGATWNVLPGGQSLPATHLFENLAYDPERNKLVAYGPYAPNPLHPSQFTYQPLTYEWDEQSGWSLVSSVGPVLVAPELVYDEARGCIVMVYAGGSPSIPQCWERRGKGAWIQKPAPTGRLNNPMYDPLRRRVVAVSVPYLRAYAPVHPAPFTTFGPGCPGLLGTPSMRLTASHTAAWIGDSLQITVERLPGAVAGIFLGYSNTTSQGVPLPLDLDAAGMPNCDLHVSLDAFWICSGTGTQCEASIAVPNSTALLDHEVYLQAVVPAPTVNAAGLVLSDAAAARIGSR